MDFPHNSSKFRAFRTVHPLKRHVFLEVLVENKAFHFLKRALRAGTACNKCLRKALLNFTGSPVFIIVTTCSITFNNGKAIKAVPDRGTMIYVILCFSSPYIT